MNNILSITSKASKQIKKIISKAPIGMDSVVIGVDKSGCSGYAYKLDFGKSSDYKNDKLASRFIFENPNEKSTCGCGESFSV